MYCQELAKIAHPSSTNDPSPGLTICQYRISNSKAPKRSCSVIQEVIIVVKLYLEIAERACVCFYTYKTVKKDTF